MGAARKLREQEKPVQLTPLRTIEKDKNMPIKSFIILLLVLAALIIGISTPQNSDNAKKESLEEFAQKSLKNKSPDKKKFILDKASTKQIEKIKELNGLDISLYIWTLDNYAIRHIFRRHPETKIDDLNKIYSLLNNFDYIKEVSYNKKSVPEIEINKIIGEKNYRLFVEIRKRELSITTLYANKIKKPE